MAACQTGAVACHARLRQRRATARKEGKSAGEERKQTGEKRKGKKKGMGLADGRLTGGASGAVRERRDGGRVWAKAEVERPTNWAAGVEVKPRRAGASECRRRRAGQQR